MAYTKEQLIQALCEARQCSVKELKTVEGYIQQRIDVERERLTAELAALPKSAKEEMKREALEYLIRQTRTSILAENNEVTL
jgi:hypothetical protein